MHLLGVETKRSFTTRHRSMPSWNLIAMTVMALGVACGTNPVATEAPTFTVRFSLSNRLVAPVTLFVDGVPHVALLGGGNTHVAVPSTARWLSWTSAKPAGANGVP